MTGDGPFASLRGQLLVASPVLRDPNFARSVVVLTEHTPDGAMGFVLNRPLELTVAEAVPPLAALVPDDEPVFLGGPVQPQAVMALGQFADPAASAEIAFADVGFLRADGEHDGPGPGPGPERVRVFGGYSGWGPGQLEDELGDDAWLVVPARADDVFAAPEADLWADVLRRRGGPYAMLALMPDDPSVN